MLAKAASFLGRQYQSLIFRVLIYFILASLVVAVVLGWNFVSRIKPHFYNEILPNLSQYIEYLVADIGSPPDLQRAAELTDKLPFELRIEGRGVEWSSTPALLPVNYHPVEPAPFPYQNYSIGHLDNSHLLLVESGSYQYLFVIDSSFRSQSRHRHWVLFILLSGVLATLYFAIRKLFYPLQTISDHLKKIGAGELEQSLDIKGGNELSLLADGINEMMLKIRSMLENKASLLLAISHELRSPITRMRVNIELLQSSEKKELLLMDIREMEYLVATILETERLNSGHSQLIQSQFDMAELVQDVVTQYFEACSMKLSLASIRVNLDKSRIHLLVKNIIDNACRYSAESDRPVEIKLEQKQQSLQLTVKDYGPGVSSDGLSNLAEPFYRSDAARQRTTGGYGLGLYLCRLIIEAHNGTLGFESEPGQGMTVIIELPLFEDNRKTL